LAGALLIAQVLVDRSEPVHRQESVGVIVAEDPSAGGKSLLAQVAGTLEVALVAAGLGEMAHRNKGTPAHHLLWWNGCWKNHRNGSPGVPSTVAALLA
jgi:hypothetical protein